MSVTDLSTTIIWVSNTSEPICIRQNTATRREPANKKCGVCKKTENPLNNVRIELKVWYTKKRHKLTPSVVKVVWIPPHQWNAQPCTSREEKWIVKATSSFENFSISVNRIKNWWSRLSDLTRHCNCSITRHTVNWIWIWKSETQFGI